MAQLFYPDASPAEYVEAYTKLGFSPKTKQNKDNLNAILEKIKGIEQTLGEDMLLSGVGEILPAQQSNSYCFLLLYSYTEKASYLQQILDVIEQNEKFANLSSIIQYNEQFGQLYAVVVVTKILKQFPLRTMELLIKQNFFSQFINLIENNSFSQYEMQLIDLAFQHLESQQLQLSDKSKASLLEQVQRQYTQKSMEGSEYLLIYIRNLKSIVVNQNFKQQVFDVNTLQAVAIQLSAWFFKNNLNVDHKLLSKQKNIIKPEELEIISTQVYLICYIYGLAAEINEVDIQDEIIAKLLEVTQDLDIFQIFQKLTYIDTLKLPVVAFFGNNAQSRKFCSTVIARFASKECIPTTEYLLHLLSVNCIEVQTHSFNFLTGCCLDNQFLKLVVDDVTIVNKVKEVITTNLVSHKLERFLEPATGVLKVLFRMPQIFIDYNNLEFTSISTSQISIFSQTKAGTILSNEFFELVLHLAELYPDNQNFIDVLFFVCQLRINLMPFLHQVSTLDLLRRKFSIQEKRQFLPDPSNDEIKAIIYLLKHKNPKLSSILPFALTTFCRYEEKVKLITNTHKQLIINNINIMLQSVIGLSEYTVKNQDAKKQKLGLATKEAFKESLTLLSIICNKGVSNKDNIKALCQIFVNWVQTGQVNEEFAELTVKYVAKIVKNGGSALAKESSKIGPIGAIVEGVKTKR